MKKPMFVLGCVVALVLMLGAGFSADGLTLTVLYDNYVAQEGTRSDWGFACLIEGLDRTILFDAGARPEILAHNIEKLKVDLGKVNQIVITHNHEDHTGGLSYVLKQNSKVSVYFPASFPKAFGNRIEKFEAKAVRVDEPMEICQGAFLTGEMGDQIKEQSLILDTPKGLVVVTGCSHQGIVNILEKAKEIRNKDIYLVCGGFHLMEHTPQQIEEIIRAFQSLGLAKCGATHCTGDQAIGLFKAAYGENYVAMGTGRVLTIP